MDGKTVVSGDQVFDIAFGPGTVSSLRNSRFTVKLASGTVSIYDNDGRSVSFARRTLFWSDPLVGVYPPNPNATIQLVRAQAHASLDAALNATLAVACQP